MSVFKCKMCGGTIEFYQGSSIGVCDSCGTKQTLPKTSDDVVANLFTRANNLRLKCEFDKAEQIYEKIVEQYDSEAEAHWGIVLCKYGIEYVEDPKTHNRVPTCHRTLFDAVTKDPDYLSAIDYSDPIGQSIYESEARAIDRIQRDILAIVKNEKPFDVFICYKETDENGKRTVDSTIANDIYYQLTQEGLKVFYAAITLEDKIGQEYEPYIFAALNSAKVMLVIGTKPEYFNAVWVKNEWSRFMNFMKTDRTKLLIPCYRDMDAYDLPGEFAHLQAQDMSKIGFINDIVRGIKKVVKPKEENTVKHETVIVKDASGTGVAPLLKRAFLFLEDEEWKEAEEYCEKVLDQDPENAQAYLGKLMAELHVRKQDDLKDCAESFSEFNNYQKAVRFADSSLVDTLKGYIKYINDRNEKARLTSAYNEATLKMHSAKREKDFSNAAEVFAKIKGFKDADNLYKECLDKAECCRKNDVYSKALNSIYCDSTQSVEVYERAVALLITISGWKDAEEQIAYCNEKIEEIKANGEAERLKAEHKAEEDRIAAEKAAKKRKKIAAIVVPSVVAGIAFVVLLITVIIPTVKYNAAVELMNNEQYEKAIAAFESMNGYKDSTEQIAACQTALKDIDYDAAVALMNNKQYEEAIAAFEVIDGYKDSPEKITECKYDYAIELMEDSDYKKAVSIFETLDGYKDSKERISLCNDAVHEIDYCEALDSLEKGLFSKALDVFKKLGDYKDSKQKVNELSKSLLVNSTTKYSIGDELTLGRYEQNNDLSDGKESIEWIVLEINGKTALVISKYALDCKMYETEKKDSVWNNSSIRNWLNSDFYNAAFNDKEKELICLSTFSADKNPKYATNPGSNTEDYISLLSLQEANRLFKSDTLRRCTGTKYCVSQGLSSVDGTCWWWLRTPGYHQDYVAVVNPDGSLNYSGGSADIKDDGVRPIMWVKISSGTSGTDQTSTKTETSPTSSFGQYLKQSQSQYTEDDFSTPHNSSSFTYLDGKVLSANGITYEISADEKNIYCLTNAGGCEVWKNGALVKKDYIVKATPSLRLREEPNTSSAILSEAAYTSRVTIDYVRDGWGYATINGKSGWLSMDYLDEPYTPKQYSGEALQALNAVKEHAYWVEGVIERDYLFASYSTKHTGHDWQIFKNESGQYYGDCFIWGGTSVASIYSFSIYKSGDGWSISEDRIALKSVVGNTIDEIIRDAEYKSAILDNDLNNSIAQTEYITIAGEQYSLWDSALNAVCGKLEDKLDSTTMSALTSDQKNWINEKEAALSQIDTQYGGMGARFDECYVAYTMTKDRVYYLVQNYNK